MLFIHSFILNIYVAPLQENYSEALPTPARSNKAVLRWEKNAGEVVIILGESENGSVDKCAKIISAIY